MQSDKAVKKYYRRPLGACITCRLDIQVIHIDKNVNETDNWNLHI